MNFQLREIKNQNRPLRVFLVKVIRVFVSLPFTSYCCHCRRVTQVQLDTWTGPQMEKNFKVPQGIMNCFFVRIAVDSQFITLKEWN